MGITDIIKFIVVETFVELRLGHVVDTWLIKLRRGCRRGCCRTFWAATRFLASVIRRHFRSRAFLVILLYELSELSNSQFDARILQRLCSWAKVLKMSSSSESGSGALGTEGFACTRGS